jgi:carbamoyltransferase
LYILGINAYHGDSSACIVKDGELIAAAEEERFRRIKHWAGFPTEAIKYCLKEANIKVGEIDHITVNRNPKANLSRKIIFTLKKKPDFSLIKERLQNYSEIGNIKKTFNQEFQIDESSFRASIVNVEHHLAHMASCFFVSPFDSAAILSIDGFGDFVSTMTGEGHGNKIDVFDKVYYPHSMGLFYTALTQFLGFKKYGDEYKVMGLAGLGEPKFLKNMQNIVKIKPNGLFELNLDYFVHHTEGVTMSWDSAEPTLSDVFSKSIVKLFGNPRNYNEPITEHHQDIASSLQTMYEIIFFHILNSLYQRTKNPRLCLAGGCALNSVANGKIFDNTPFREVYIQAAAGDAGGALGAAYYLYNQVLKNKRNFCLETVYWGPQFSKAEIDSALDEVREHLSGCSIERINGGNELTERTAKAISEGKVVGWFQGRMEWGPRALGNRSILVDPRRKEMKDVLNARIKRREWFRPFAPSILLEKVSEYFEKYYPDPFMIKVYPIRKEKREVIPAVTHVDGTGRLQTVKEVENPLYYKLIKEFEKLTGIPVVLNTSFNENEPIVCSPGEALDCFLRTKMDVLVLQNYFISKQQ